MNDLGKVISRNLVSLRLQKDLSLDQLAALSGVSKTDIEQIERGTANPAINTVWKIVTGLNIPFNELLGKDASGVELIQLADIEPLTDDQEGMRLFPLFSIDPNKQLEIFTVILSAHCTHTAAPHKAGSEEYVLLSEGALEVRVHDEVYRLAPGDVLHFPSDQPHIYHNPSGCRARFRNMIHYPNQQV